MAEAALTENLLRPERVRPIAICVFRDGERIFVAEGYDPVKQQTFYRPLGGTIDFGEHGHETIVRELQEEAGLEVANLRYLGALENIFTYNGRPGHEIVLVYDGEFADRSVYARAELECQEIDGVPFKAVWKRLEEFDSRTPVYPDGLVEMLCAESRGKE